MNLIACIGCIELPVLIVLAILGALGFRKAKKDCGRKKHKP